MRGRADIDQAVAAAVNQGWMPGAVLAFGRGDELLYCRAFGEAARFPRSLPMHEETLFDLASLTKVLATTLLLMKRWENQALDLDAPLGTHLPGRYPKDKSPLSLRLLLTHTSGLPASLRLCDEFSPQPADGDTQRRLIIERVLTTPLTAEPATRALYSDLGLIVSGDLLEHLSGATLDRLCEAEISAPLGLDDTFFVHLDAPLAKAQRAAGEFAATEDCPWRRRVIQGQVHDETAYLLRGVAGHAGLFSRMSDLLRLTRVLTGASGFITEDTVRRFTSRQNVVPDSTRAIGWDTAGQGSSCGHHFSARAFGHTGFTGTSFWVDPETGLFVILLANRIHPAREDTGFLGFRPSLHDLIAGTVGLT